MQQVLANGNKRKKYVQKMFNDIAHRYDLLNHLLSGGTDIYWRRKAISKLNISPDSLVLDIACGTGDFAFTTQKLKNSNVIGLDIATKMLSLGKQKAMDKRQVMMEQDIADFKYEANGGKGFSVRNKDKLIIGAIASVPTIASLIIAAIAVNQSGATP